MKKIYLLLLSVILFTLSFPNPIFLSGISGLSIIALVPLFLALIQCKFIFQVMRLGLYFGASTTFLCYFWLTKFGDFSIWTLSGVMIVYIVEYPLLFVLLWVILKRYTNTLRPLLLALVWTGYEYCKSVGFLGFPWTLVPHSFHNILPVIQIVKLGGTWILSLLIVYINALLLEYFLLLLNNELSYRPQYFIHNSKYDQTRVLYQHSIFAGIMIFGVLLFGSIELYKSKSIHPQSKFNALLVQQNFDSWESAGMRDSLYSILSQTQIGLEQSKHPLDMLIWSETTLSYPYQLEIESANILYNEKFYDYSFLSFMKHYNLPLLTGAPWIEDQTKRILFNSALLIHPNGRLIGKYGKNQLVPFAEYIPLFEYSFVQFLTRNIIGLYSTWLPSRKFNTLSWDFASLPSFDNNIEKTNTFKNPELISKESFPHYEGIQYPNTPRHNGTLQLGIPICFEDSFSYVTRNFVKNGADILVNITNVQWSKTKTTQMQQLVASRFRSIETGRTMLRSTNSGVTSIIDPWGRILVQIPMFESATLETEVPIYKISTPYIIIGDIIGILSFIISSLLFVVIIIREYYIFPRKYQKLF